MAARPFPIRLAVEGDQEAKAKIQAVVTAVTGLQQQFDRTAQAARSQDIAAYGAELDRLRAKYNPLFAAQAQHRAALDELNRALKVGAISEAEYGAALSRTRAAYAQQSAALQGMGSALQRGAGFSRNFGASVQQAGFQVGDFAVQVASGQDPMRAFIQQGTQLVSIFGVWGSVLGAAGAVVGALAVGLLDLGDATEEAAEAEEKRNALMERAQELTSALTGATYDLVRARRAERDLAIESARAETAKLEAELEARRQAVEAHIRLGLEEGRIAGGADLDAAVQGAIAVDPEAQGIDARLRALREYRAELGEFEDQISRGTAGGAGLPAGWEEDRAKLLASLREEADLIGKTGVEREIAVNLAKAHATAESDLGRVIVELTTRIYDWNEAVKSGAQAEKDRLKAIEENETALRAAIEAEAAAWDSIGEMEQALRAEREALRLTDRERFVRAKRLEAERALTEAGIEVSAVSLEQLEREAELLYDATQAREARTRAERDAQRERERLAEQEAEILRRPFENALDGMQDAFTDFFQDVFSGGIDSFRDLADGIKGIFTRLAAELAALMVIRPVFAGIAGGLGLGGGAGLMPTAGGTAAGGLGIPGVGLSDLFGIGKQFLGAGSGIHSFLFGLPAVGGSHPIAATSGLLGSGGALFGSSFLADAFLPGIGAALPGLISGNWGQAGLGLGGALAGTAIGGPIGGVIGGLLGNVLGGLLGGKKKTPQAVTSFDFGGGLTEWTRAGGNIGATNQLAKGLADTVASVVEQLGGTLSANATGGYILTSSGKNQGTIFLGGVGQYGSGTDLDKIFGAGFQESIKSDPNAIAEAVAVAVLKENARTGAIAGLSATQMQVLRATDSSNLQGLNADLGFAQWYEQVTGLAPETTQAAEAIRALKAQFKDAREEAARLGLDVAKLTAAEQKALAQLTADFDRSIGDQILALTDPLALALQQLEEAQAARLEEAKALGADLVEVERLSALERQRVIEQAGAASVGSLQKLLAELTYGGLSGGTAVQSYGGLGAAFEATRAQSLAGDAAARARLGELIPQFLAASQAVNASSGAYFADRDRAIALLEALGVTLPGFAAGGSFTVAGAGGIDSQLVAFRATPGERVTVSNGNDQLARTIATAGAQQTDAITRELAAMRQGLARQQAALDRLLARLAA